MKNSRVIPSVIRKMATAKANNKESITLLGSGITIRGFLYVEDAVDAIILATEKSDKFGPVNIGSKETISLKNLANLIRELTGYKGKVIWDVTNASGDQSRYLDISKAIRELDFIAKTPLKNGLIKTISWFNNNYEKGKGNLD